MSQEPQPARNQPRRHAAPGDPAERDEQYTVAEQLSRIVFYDGPNQAVSVFRRITWATDEQKAAALTSHSVMTSNGHGDGWAAL
jgi:hypothetical protein